MEHHFPERIATIHERIKWLVDYFADGKNTIFADKLGVNEANVRSYVRGVQPKADFLSNIVTTYDINALWLLTGAGFPLQSNTQPEEPPKVLTSDATIKDFFEQFGPFLQRKDAKIIQQAEEIGKLKERIAQLEREKNVSAESSNTAPRELSESTLDL